MTNTDQNSCRQQQEAEEELHAKTIAALVNSTTGVATIEDLHILAWHAGIDYDKEVAPYVAAR